MKKLNTATVPKNLELQLYQYALLAEIKLKS